MPIDHQRLSRLRRYEDPAGGFFEEFLDRRLGPDGSLALLAAPLAEPRPQGYVLCPSVGPEHGNTRRLEALVARGLAASGFTALRLRPDVDPAAGVMTDFDLAARTAEVEAGVELLATELGLQSVGLVGTLFGGAVAALVADRRALPSLVVIEPVSRGAQYARDTMRRVAVADLMATAEVEDTGDGPRPQEELEQTGRTTIRGLGLTREELERISAVDLVKDVRSFRGRALLVGVSPTGAPSPGLRKLHEHLESLGADVTREVLVDPLYAPFGDYYYRHVGLVKVDTRLELDQTIARSTVAWATGATAGAHTAEVA